MESKIYAFIAGLTVAGALGACNSSNTEDNKESENLIEFVNPLVGSGDHGHVFVGANVPFGFVQLGPSQHVRGWDWCSGYHYSDSVIVGFSHTHLSGTGIGELGDVTFLPTLNPAVTESLFSHEDETVRPGYYKVVFSDTGISAELTATERTGMHRYTFPASADTAYVRLDLAYGIGWDKATDTKIYVDSDSTVTGSRFSTGWAKDQKIYFAANFSRPFASCALEGDSIAIFGFTEPSEPVELKVGLSATSVKNALNNLNVENPGWDFDEVARKAAGKWNKALATVQVKGSSDEDKKLFYTALYHTMFAPSVFSDVSGDYYGADGEIHSSGDGVIYTTFSLWDTYRAAHPMYTLLFPEMQSDLARTFIKIYEEQGVLPEWHLVGNETWCMQGNPGVVVLTDLALKGFDMDLEKAFEAAKNSALADNRSLDLLKKYGYVPFNLDPAHETVAKGLEYALADAGVAKLADKLGKTEDAEYFGDRSRSYRKYYDPSTKFMRGLSSDGHFSEPFDPFHSEPAKGDYCEGNAWQYLWLVPHDVHGLVDLMGGEDQFIEKLDSLFVVEGDFGDKVAPDLTGLIGQYVHGNEPSHHIIYMYNYVGQPWKTARWSRDVMHRFYKNEPAGLFGNEDVGQMSAWLVMAAMGMYQVEPEGGKYIFGSPLFEEVTISPEGGKQFTIKAIGNSPENIYIQSATLNGKPYEKSYIMFDDIASGGELIFQMGDTPSDTFGVAAESRP